MIILDRLIRTFNGDIYLPSECRGPPLKDRCHCKIYCKYPPRGRPIPVEISLPRLPCYNKAFLKDRNSSGNYK